MILCNNIYNKRYKLKKCESVIQIIKEDDNDYIK